MSKHTHTEPQTPTLKKQASVTLFTTPKRSSLPNATSPGAEATPTSAVKRSSLPTAASPIADETKSASKRSSLGQNEDRSNKDIADSFNKLLIDLPSSIDELENSSVFHIGNTEYRWEYLMAALIYNGDLLNIKRLLNVKDENGKQKYNIKSCIDFIRLEGEKKDNNENPQPRIITKTIAQGFPISIIGHYHWLDPNASQLDLPQLAPTDSLEVLKMVIETYPDLPYILALITPNAPKSLSSPAALDARIKLIETLFKSNVNLKVRAKKVNPAELKQADPAEDQEAESNAADKFLKAIFTKDSQFFIENITKEQLEACINLIKKMDCPISQDVQRTCRTWVNNQETELGVDKNSPEQKPLRKLLRERKAILEKLVDLYPELSKSESRRNLEISKKSDSSKSESPSALIKQKSRGSQTYSQIKWVDEEQKTAHKKRSSLFSSPDEQFSKHKSLKAVQKTVYARKKLLEGNLPTLEEREFMKDSREYQKANLGKALYYGLEEGDADVIHFCLFTIKEEQKTAKEEQKIDTNFLKDGKTALDLALQYNHNDKIVKELVKKHDFNAELERIKTKLSKAKRPNKQDEIYRESSLYLIMKKSYPTSIFEEALQNIKFEELDQQLQKILFRFAVKNNYFSYVKAILNNSPNIDTVALAGNIQMPNEMNEFLTDNLKKTQKTGSFVAEDVNQLKEELNGKTIEEVRILLATTHANIILSGEDLFKIIRFNPPLTVAEQKENTEETVTIREQDLKLFLEKTENINALNDNGENLLHFALKTGDTALIKALLTHENETIDVNITDENGNSPMHLLAQSQLLNKDEIIKLLLAKGAGISLYLQNKAGKIPYDLNKSPNFSPDSVTISAENIDLAFEYNNEKWATALLDKATLADSDIISKVKTKNQLVTDAQFIYQALNGPTINIIDADANTALHLALKNNCVKSLSKLLEKQNGGNLLYVQNIDGETAIDLAQKLNNDASKVITSFLEGKDLAQLARNCGNYEAAQQLGSAGEERKESTTPKETEIDEKNGDKILLESATQKVTEAQIQYDAIAALTKATIEKRTEIIEKSNLAIAQVTQKISSIKGQIGSAEQDLNIIRSQLLANKSEKKFISNLQLFSKSCNITNEEALTTILTELHEASHKFNKDAIKKVTDKTERDKLDLKRKIIKHLPKNKKGDATQLSALLNTLNHNKAHAEKLLETTQNDNGESNRLTGIIENQVALQDIAEGVLNKANQALQQVKLSFRTAKDCQEEGEIKRKENLINDAKSSLRKIISSEQIEKLKLDLAEADKALAQHNLEHSKINSKLIALKGSKTKSIHISQAAARMHSFNVETQESLDYKRGAIEKELAGQIDKEVDGLASKPISEIKKMIRIAQENEAQDKIAADKAKIAELINDYSFAKNVSHALSNNLSGLILGDTKHSELLKEKIEERIIELSKSVHDLEDQLTKATTAQKEEKTDAVAPALSLEDQILALGKVSEENILIAIKNKITEDAEKTKKTKEDPALTQAKLAAREIIKAEFLALYGLTSSAIYEKLIGQKLEEVKQDRPKMETEEGIKSSTLTPKTPLTLKSEVSTVAKNLESEFNFAEPRKRRIGSQPPPPPPLPQTSRESSSLAPSIPAAGDNLTSPVRKITVTRDSGGTFDFIAEQKSSEVPNPEEKQPADATVNTTNTVAVERAETPRPSVTLRTSRTPPPPPPVKEGKEEPAPPQLIESSVERLRSSSSTSQVI